MEKKTLIQKLSLESLKALKNDYEVFASIYRCKMKNAEDKVKEIEKEIYERVSKTEIKVPLFPKNSDNEITGPMK